MKTIFAYDPWRLVENELHKDDMRLSESMTSTGASITLLLALWFFLTLLLKRTR